MVSHAGRRSKLRTGALSEAADGLRARRAGHHRGRVLVGVAMAIADGLVTITAGEADARLQALCRPGDYADLCWVLSTEGFGLRGRHTRGSTDRLLRLAIKEGRWLVRVAAAARWW